MSWLKIVCHDCDAKVGELHKLGCDMERCPICGAQLISCNGVHFTLVEAGSRLRIPYIQPLVNCGVCGVIFPDFFDVPDEEWDKYVIPPLQDKVVCKPCYDKFKILFPGGWEKVE